MSSYVVTEANCRTHFRIKADAGSVYFGDDRKLVQLDKVTSN